MCPDNQILSLYNDNELPSPWKEKMEIHLASCKNCQTKLEQYQTVSGIFKDDKMEVPADLERRVWDKVAFRNFRTAPEKTMYKKPGIAEPQNVHFNYAGFWNRKISLPLPAAAAAAAAFIIIAFLAVQGKFSPAPVPQNEGLLAGISSDVEGIVPVSDINGVIQYLSREDTADFMIIRLPETRNFSSYGEPALLKAADYSRRISSR